MIEGIVGEYLAREYNQVTYQHFKSGREIDFFVKGKTIEVKQGRERKGGKVDYLPKIDEFDIEENQLTLPVSNSPYLISSYRIFYEITE